MTLLLLTFVGLLLIGTPIAIAMIASSALVIWTEGIPLTIVAQRVFAGLQSFPLLAVPLFTLAGSLMNESGISERLFGFTKALVGHIRGGLAQTAIVGNVFLSGISGSSVADCAATTRVLVPQLVASGYSRGFGAALAASAGTLGPIIPPSILMVLYAWQANVSLGALFVAGLLPGLVMAGAMMLVIAVMARLRRYPTSGAFSASRLWQEFKRAFWALMMPVHHHHRLPDGRLHRDRDRRHRRALLRCRRHLRLPQPAAGEDPDNPARHGPRDGGHPDDRRRRRPVQLDPRHRAGAAGHRRVGARASRPSPGRCSSS